MVKNSYVGLCRVMSVLTMYCALYVCAFAVCDTCACFVISSTVFAFIATNTVTITATITITITIQENSGIIITNTITMQENIGMTYM